MAERIEMYSDMNDYLRDLYGSDIVEEYLYRDGGKSLWQLYFRIVRVHVSAERAFQRSVLRQEDIAGSVIETLYCLPCCLRDLDKPEMSAEEADSLMVLAGSFMDRESYLDTILLLNDHRLPKKYCEDLIRSMLDRYCSYAENEPLSNAEATCREELSLIFPDCETLIRDNTAAAVRAYIQAADAKAAMMDQFIGSYQSQFQTIACFYGLEVLEAAMRIDVLDREADYGDEAIEFFESLEDDFDRYLPGMDLKQSECIEFWKTILCFDPDDDLNCGMFAKHLSSIAFDADEERLNDLRQFMSKTEKLKHIYESFPEAVVNVYAYKKPMISHDLIMRMYNAAYQEKTLSDGRIHRVRTISLSRNEVLLLFLNAKPSFEDERRIMPDQIFSSVLGKILLSETEVGIGELLELLNYSKTYRLKEKALICWTETFFEQLFGSEVKEER